MKLIFQSCEINPQRRELRTNGEIKVLAPKAFSVLLFLIENRERMVSKRELLDTFWSANVSDTALLKSISLIRKALGQNKNSQAIVKTYHGLGYRFVANIENQTNNEAELLAPFVVEEHRLISVICFRVANSTSHSVLDEQVSLELEAFLNEAKSIVENYQGSLLHIMIDGFTAAFGMHVLYEDVSRRAVSCSVDLLQLINDSKLNDIGVITRVGIDTGSTLLVDEKSQQWKPPSSVERLATHLSQEAKNGDILISQETLDQLHDEVEVESYHDAFKLVSAPVLRSGVIGRRHKAPTSFVGRKAETAFLTECLNSTTNGKGSVTILSGPPGIGKTRLVSEFFSRQSVFNYKLILLNCLPSLQNTPLSPIRELCTQVVNLSNHLELSLSNISHALLREMLQKTESIDPCIKNLSVHERRQESYQMINQLLTSFCQQSPLVLVIEDIHWLDTTSEEYLNKMIRHVTDKQLMVVMTTRPVEKHFHIEVLLNLSPLAHSDCKEMLRSNASMSVLSDKTTDVLISRSEGNPFFLEELAFAAQSDKHTDADALTSESIQAVITVRIGSLPLALRSLVYIMAVIGSPTEINLIAHLNGQRKSAVILLLDQLIKFGFIVRTMDRYAFRHMLINDTAYSIIARPDRIKLHAQIADYLVKLEGEEATRPEILAWHYQKSKNVDKAMAFWGIASRDALKRFNYNEAATFAQKGLDLPESHHVEEKHKRLDMLLIRATSLTTLHGFSISEAGDAYIKAQALNREVGSAKTQIHVLVGLWLHYWVLGELSKSLNYAIKLMTLAEKTRMPSIQLQAHTSLGQVLMHMGRTEEALDNLRKGLHCIQNELPCTWSGQNVAASCAAYAAWCASLLGREEDAKNYYQQSQYYAKLFKNPFAMSIHYALCSEYFLFIGDVQKCFELANKAVTVSRKHNFSFWLGTGLVLRGWALGQQDKQDQAFDALNEGISIFQSTGAGVQMSNWFGLKAEIELLTGKFLDGLQSVQKALQYADKTGDVHFKPRVHTIAAELYQRMNDSKQSEEHLLQAQELIKCYGITPKVVCLSRTYDTNKIDH